MRLGDVRYLLKIGGGPPDIWRVGLFDAFWEEVGFDDRGWVPLYLRQCGLLGPAKAPFGDPGTWVMHVLETMIGSIVIGEPFSRNDYIP